MRDHERAIVFFQLRQHLRFPVGHGVAKFFGHFGMLTRDVRPLALIDSNGEEFSLVVEQEFFSPHRNAASPV